MQPQLVGGHHEEIILAYKRDQIQRWDSNERESLTLVALERSLIPPEVKTTISGQHAKPEISQEAQVLAKQLTPKENDPYALGIKAQAEGRLEEAKTLFEQAEKLEKAHKEKTGKDLSRARSK